MNENMTTEKEERVCGTCAWWQAKRMGHAASVEDEFRSTPPFPIAEHDYPCEWDNVGHKKYPNESCRHHALERRWSDEKDKPPRPEDEMEEEIEWLRAQLAVWRSMRADKDQPPWLDPGQGEDVARLQVQLAGCLAAAEGHTRLPAKEGDYGWSPTYEAVLNLRRKYEKLNADDELPPDPHGYITRLEATIQLLKERCQQAEELLNLSEAPESWPAWHKKRTEWLNVLLGNNGKDE